MAVLWLAVTKLLPALQNGWFPATLWTVSIALLALGAAGFWQMRWWGVALLLAAGIVVVAFTSALYLFSPVAIAASFFFSAVAFGPALLIAQTYRDRFRA